MSLDISGRSLHLTMRWNENDMGAGTGFIGEFGGRHYLISVKHNFTGRDPVTGRFLGGHAISPNNVVIRASASDPKVGWRNLTFPLVDEDWEPLWFEHPTHPEYDVAALEITIDPDARLQAYLLDEPSPDIHPMLAVTDELYVVGFPRGLAYNVNMPIWSRATVASEPGAGYNGMPIFLVDVRTTKGHSGSPLVIKPRLNQPVRMADGSIHVAGSDDAWVAGVYSGRVKSRGHKIDTGIVWRLGAIVRVIESRTVRNDKGQTRWLALAGEFV